jgi:hypothetical protein
MDGSASDLIAVLIAGDSHVTGFRPQRFAIEGAPGKPLAAEIKPAFIDTAALAFDMVVTFPDGRTGLNPLVAYTLKFWPGLDIKGRPLEAGTTVHKQLVLSLGTGISHYDPAIAIADRVANSLMFPVGVDFILPDQPQLPVDPNSTLIPVALMRDMFEAILQPLKAGLGLMAADYPGRLWILCAPPPPLDNVSITALFANAGAKDTPIPSTAVLLKIWLLLRSYMNTICRETGCHFLDSAPVACDKTGFLKPELVHDGIHGNALYYELMARHIVATVAAAAR